MKSTGEGFFLSPPPREGRGPACPPTKTFWNPLGGGPSQPKPISQPFPVLSQKYFAAAPGRWGPRLSTHLPPPGGVQTSKEACTGPTSKTYQLAFNSNDVHFRIAKFKRSNLGPKFALKMGPKFALTDIFRNKMGRGYLLMNRKSPKFAHWDTYPVRSLCKSEVILLFELNAGWVCL
jgi:hypothetical protein